MKGSEPQNLQFDKRPYCNVPECPELAQNATTWIQTMETGGESVRLWVHVFTCVAHTEKVQRVAHANKWLAEE
jgi:hypothetical protein